MLDRIARMANRRAWFVAGFALAFMLVSGALGGSVSSQLHATLSVPGTECTASGPLADSYNGTMTCSDRQVIPLRLRVK